MAYVRGSGSQSKPATAAPAQKAAQSQSAPGQQGGYKKQAKGNYSGNAQRGGQQPQGGKQTPMGEAKRRPDFDIVEIDSEGNIMKEDVEINGEMKNVNKRIGAVWMNEKSGFVKFDDGRTAKLFFNNKD